jgi:NADPH-dependent 2,4-dienoyl-CoA reductase/sulfur reductase-like enzyme
VLRAARAQSPGRIVVVGGGFGGASAAREAKRLAPQAEVTLVEANETFTACPFSNEVIVGLRDIERQRFGYDGLHKSGIAVRIAAAKGIDPEARRVDLADGTSLAYDRLVLSPGIDLRWDAVHGYDEAAAERMPHAWKAGAQTLLLRRQLEAMEDGGLVVIAAPANPARCPAAVYERASLVAHYLKARKPRSKVIVLDAKDSFPIQRPFQAAWKALYPDHLEWVGLSQGGRLASVDPATMTVSSDFEEYKAAVVSIVPPQRAGALAAAAGVADRTGWCAIDPATFESTLQPGIHVVGDAAISGALPKSAFGASAAGKACAAAVVALLRSEKPPEMSIRSTCYSLVAPGYGISLAGAYRPGKDLIVEIEGSAATSPADAPPETRAREAAEAEAWFAGITSEIFG